MTCILLILSHNISSAQNIETIINARPVTMGGNFSMSDNVDLLGDSISNYYYINGAVNTKFFGIVDVPISFAFTDNTLTKNLAMPFNRFSLSPSYKQLKAYIGYNSLSFSKYTLSGHDFLGGGAGYDSELGWSVLGFYGRLRKAVAPDSTTSEAGYRRMGGGLMVGYRGDKYDVSANFIKIADDGSSMSFDGFLDQYVNPEDNFASSVSFNLRLVSNVTVLGEYAVSSMKTRIDENKITDVQFPDEKIIYQAFEVGAQYNAEIFSVGVSYNRLPPNYETLGGYYFSEDEEQVSLTFASSILKRINFSGDIGYRHDNVKEQNITTNKSMAYSLSFSGSVIDGLSFNASMNNDQNYVNLRDNYLQVTKVNEFEDLDTNEYSRLSESFVFGLNYQLPQNESVSQSVFTSFSLQKTSDEQRYDTLSSLAKVLGANAGYSATFNVPKLSFSANFGYSKTDTKAQDVDIKTYSITLGRNFFEKLSLSSVYTFADTRTDSIKSRVHNAKLNATYNMFQKHNLGLSACFVRNPLALSFKNRWTLSVNYSCNFDIINSTKKKNEEDS